MPELVDVEGFRRQARQAAGKRIDAVRVWDATVLRDISVGALRSRLEGRCFAEPWRYGKWLILPVGGTDEAVLLHFGMTGSLSWQDPADEPHQHDRVEFRCDGGGLRYRDMRKLQGLRLLANQHELRAQLAELGPDADTLSRAQLADTVGGTKRQLKRIFMDQSVVAGLGNLMTDEILWHARLHPRRRAAALEPEELRRLHSGMREVLRRGKRLGHVPSRGRWLTAQRDDPHGSCPRCGTALRHDRVGSRTTVWCPTCQPAAE